MNDIPKELKLDDLQARYRWKKVEAPKPWRPTSEGEVLVGFYGGQTVRNGRFDQYRQAIVHVPVKGSFVLSGVKIIQLFDSSGVEIGRPVRVVWRGDVELKSLDEEGKPKKMKTFEVYIAEGVRLPASSLPEVSENPQ